MHGLNISLTKLGKGRYDGCNQLYKNSESKKEIKSIKETHWDR